MSWGKNKKRALPDRWESYLPFGKPIPGTRFLAFKVPLKHQIAVPEQDGSLFTPANMIESFQSRGLNVGLIVDLTNTKRYYGEQVTKGLFAQNKIAYCKILVEGQVIPRYKHIGHFQRVVSEFLAQDPDRLVGVHCTHGLNRTGYMICRFMIEKMGWKPDEAICAFDEARGHKQERHHYLHDLRKLHPRNRGLSSAEPSSTSSCLPPIADRPDNQRDLTANSCGNFRLGSFSNGQQWPCNETDKRKGLSTRDPLQNPTGQPGQSSRRPFLLHSTHSGWVCSSKEQANSKPRRYNPYQ